MRDSGFPQAEIKRIGELCQKHDFGKGSLYFETDNKLGDEYISRLTLIGINVSEQKDEKPYGPPHFRIIKPVIYKNATTTISGYSSKRRN